MEPCCDERSLAALQTACEPVSPVFPSVGSSRSLAAVVAPANVSILLKDFTFNRFQQIRVAVDPSPQFLYEPVGLFLLPDLLSVGSIRLLCLEELIGRNTLYRREKKNHYLTILIKI